MNSLLGCVIALGIPGLPTSQFGAPWWNLPGPAMVVADPVEEARGEVSAVMRLMEAAVLAGDRDGYLRHVDRADSCFWWEQQHWADDLKHEGGVPIAFSLAMEDPSFVLKDDSAGAAEFSLTMTWHMPGEKARERSVSFPVRFVRGEQGDGGDWKYAGEVWEVVEGELVKVLHQPGLGEAAKAAAAVLPGVRKHVHTGFELEKTDLPGSVQEVKLYSSMKHLQASIYLSYEDGLSGWNEPREAIKLWVSGRTGEAALGPLLAHEYGHVATFAMGEQATAMPWWAVEGVAELSAETMGGRSGEYAWRRVLRWHREGQLLEWEKLADFRGEAANHYDHVYAQGQHMLGYISERFGRTGRNTWLTEMARGKTLDEASRSAFRRPWAEIDTDWRAEIRAEADKKPDPKESEKPAG